MNAFVHVFVTVCLDDDLQRVVSFTNYPELQLKALGFCLEGTVSSPRLLSFTGSCLFTGGGEGNTNMHTHNITPLFYSP